MNREERRLEIVRILSTSSEPVSGSQLAKLLGVSRQVIVQDIAIIREKNQNILSTTQGYIVNKPMRCKRIYKVCHEDSHIQDELNTIVDAGGKVLDVFVYHSIYGRIQVDLLIATRLDVKKFIDNFEKGKVSALKKLTLDYHFHTIEADSEEILDIIEKELKEKSYLINTN